MMKALWACTTSVCGHFLPWALFTVNAGRRNAYPHHTHTHTHTHQNNNNNKTCTDRDFFSFFFFSFSIPMLKIISFSIMVCNICLYIFNFYLCISSTLIIQVKLSIPVTFSRIHASDYHVYDHAMSHPSPIPEKEKKKEKKNHNQQRCVWPGG